MHCIWSTNTFPAAEMGAEGFPSSQKAFSGYTAGKGRLWSFTKMFKVALVENLLNGPKTIQPSVLHHCNNSESPLLSTLGVFIMRFAIILFQNFLQGC